MAVRSQRIQEIHGGEDACANRNLFSPQTERISRPVPLLVVRPNNRYDGIREAHSLQDLGPDHRMDLHLLEFFWREPPRFGDNVLGYRQLAYVMQQRRRVQGFHLVRGNA